MICVSLANINHERCLEIMKQEELVELRLDLLPDDLDLSLLFKLPVKTIVTFRPKEDVSEEARLKKLIFAIQAGAYCVDIELDTSNEYRSSIIEVARKYGCKVIISYHNFNETPEDLLLNRTLNECYGLGCDIAKVACLVNKQIDNIRLLTLLKSNRPLIVVGMGEIGKVTRVVAPLLGSFCSYAALDEHNITAPGQVAATDLKHIYLMLKEHGISSEGGL